MSMDFVPKNRSLPPSGARDCARLCQIDVFYNTTSPGYLSFTAFQVSLNFGMLRLKCMKVRKFWKNAIACQPR